MMLASGTTGARYSVLRTPFVLDGFWAARSWPEDSKSPERHSPAGVTAACSSHHKNGSSLILVEVNVCVSWVSARDRVNKFKFRSILVTLSYERTRRPSIVKQTEGVQVVKNRRLKRAWLPVNQRLLPLLDSKRDASLLKCLYPYWLDA